MKNSTGILALCLLLSLVSLYHTNLARSHADSELFTLNNRFLDVKNILPSQNPSKKADPMEVYNKLDKESSKPGYTVPSDVALCDEYKVYLWGYYCSPQETSQGGESCPVVPLDDIDLVYLYGYELKKNKELQDVRYVDIKLPLEKESWIHLSKEAGRTADVLYWAQVLAECSILCIIGSMLLVRSMPMQLLVFMAVASLSYNASLNVHEAERYLEHILVVIVEKFNYTINDQSIKVFQGSQIYHSVTMCDMLFTVTACLSLVGGLMCVFESFSTLFALPKKSSEARRAARRRSRERSTTTENLSTS